MRRALNENPVVQIALIGVLLMVGAFFLLMRGGGGEADSTPAPSASTDPTAGATAAPATPATPSAPAASGTSAAPPATPMAELTAGPGLPRKVLASYRANDVVALLVVRRGGVDDELVRDSVQALRGARGVSVFVTESRHIARYARITQGAAVDRTPALVVVRPQNLTDGPPQAIVRYGFRSSRSVVQAVRDAVYKGPERSYDP